MNIFLWIDAAIAKKGARFKCWTVSLNHSLQVQFLVHYYLLLIVGSLQIIFSLKNRFI